MKKTIYLTAYGNKEGQDKGIIRLELDTESGNIKKEGCISLDGKSNMVLEEADQLVTSVKGKESSRLEFYMKDGKKTGRVDTDLFYSYAASLQDRILLASYESGVDSVYDRNEKMITKTVRHTRNGFDRPGKSHFIGALKQGQCVSIENELQQIYLYKNPDLEIEKVIDLPDAEKNPKNIRLCSFSKDREKAYINTELTNQLIVYDTEEFRLLKEISMTESENTFSGGNAISSQGDRLCVSLRGKDSIQVYSVGQDGMPIPEYEFSCGKTPRDLKLCGEYLLVSCTDADRVEMYKLLDKDVQKVGKVEVYQPITFAIEGE